jgi:hypothetical protein
MCSKYICCVFLIISYLFPGEIYSNSIFFRWLAHAQVIIVCNRCVVLVAGQTRMGNFVCRAETWLSVSLSSLSKEEEEGKKWDRERNKRAAVRKKDAKTRPVSPATGTTWWMSEFSSFATRARLMLHTSSSSTQPGASGCCAFLLVISFMIIDLTLNFWQQSAARAWPAVLYMYTIAVFDSKRGRLYLPVKLKNK